RKPTEPCTAQTSAADERWTHDPLEELGRKERHAKIAAAVAALDETSRPVVVLRYYEGLASKEIAELLEMTPAAVDMRLSRARKQLRTLLNDLVSDTPMVEQKNA
ncbi:MAG TPA: sigma-70 family RNA polymerase sigma factor, partial [Tepidisphaeraceae bacterium]|nr:sigma-70 family RNA polymerase sigma factor [Tepidisphaeraceae bacterium]